MPQRTLTLTSMVTTLCWMRHGRRVRGMLLSVLVGSPFTSTSPAIVFLTKPSAKSLTRLKL